MASGCKRKIGTTGGRALNALVNIHTKIPDATHRRLAMLAAEHGIGRAGLFEWALTFASQSSEFRQLVAQRANTKEKTDAKHD